MARLAVFLATLAWSALAFAADSADECALSLEGGEAKRAEYPGYHGFTEIYLPATPPDPAGYPVIIWYHGYSDTLKPNTRIMRAVTGGEVFIIVGMDYTTSGFYEDLEPASLDAEVLQFYTVLQEIESCVPVDRGRVIMAGYSQGGYATTLVGERVIEDLAGMIILGAGRSEGGRNLPPEEDFEDKPIFVAAGWQDFIHGENVEATARVYALLGARVSMERWPETDHVEGWSWYLQDESHTAGLRNWLNDVLAGQH